MIVQPAQRVDHLPAPKDQDPPGTEVASLTNVPAIISPVAPPSNLVYSTNPATYTVNEAITPNTPTSDGDAVDTYSVNPALPAGLSLNASTGEISGTPTLEAAEAAYTITAENAGGSTQVVLTLTVAAAPYVGTFATGGAGNLVITVPADEASNYYKAGDLMYQVFFNGFNNPPFAVFLNHIEGCQVDAPYGPGYTFQELVDDVNAYLVSQNLTPSFSLSAPADGSLASSPIGGQGVVLTQA